MRYIIITLSLILGFTQCTAQESRKNYELPASGNIKIERLLPGAYAFDEYLPMLKGKRVAIVGNQTSEVKLTLLPDTLLSLGVQVVKLFSPEHGFRGEADAGATVKSGKDSKTGLPIISLYGNNKKVAPEHLIDVDVVLYDLQDVGVRFYTYISTLEYVMQACARDKKQLIILDRPNPLWHIVDGPVLDKAHQSFVGRQAIPVIYGMTPGEYALMIKGEKWVKAENLDLKIITVKNYFPHKDRYQIPVSPSPNLKNMAAIYLYPSLCFFEGTVISLGRGTDMPFQMYGHPNLKNMPYSFTPTSMKGATNPPLKNQLCYGELVAESPKSAMQVAEDRLNLTWLLKAYKAFPNKDKFFNSFFEKLAGTSTLRQQIIQGKTEDEIRASWQPALNKFKNIRAKYLLYSKS